MKKLLFTLLLAVILPLSASAYWPYGNGFRDVTVDVTARGGYNLLEKSPMASGVVGVQFYGVRAELELGWTNFDIGANFNKKDFFFVSPMIGWSYGFNHTVYLMGGISNWAEMSYDTNPKGEPTFNNTLCGKLKVGGNLYISEHFFVNVDVSYLLPFARHQTLSYEGFIVGAGIGYRF
ncbi:MAG: hypothetical protein IJW75_05255 [Alphaproteobacteria bacterium]|nr:hypothetical protein [Alphaproteobacteria bacterium]